MDDPLVNRLVGKNKPIDDHLVVFRSIALVLFSTRVPFDLVRFGATAIHFHSIAASIHHRHQIPRGYLHGDHISIRHVLQVANRVTDLNVMK